MPLQHAAVATSGDYRHWVTVQGRALLHTIDPARGAPLLGSSASVTVIVPTCAEADAWATVLMVSGGGVQGIGFERFFLYKTAATAPAAGDCPLDREQTDRLKTPLLFTAIAGLVTGLGLHFSGCTDFAQTAWFAGVVSVLAALTFGETLAAAAVAVMYSGGTFLESVAEGRARHEMRNLLSPVQGALLQEAIDVAVILNTLRALRISPAGLTAPQTRIEGLPA